jgi:hypothetical protein
LQRRSAAGTTAACAKINTATLQQQLLVWCSCHGHAVGLLGKGQQHQQWQRRAACSPRQQQQVCSASSMDGYCDEYLSFDSNTWMAGVHHTRMVRKLIRFHTDPQPPSAAAGGLPAAATGGGAAAEAAVGSVNTASAQPPRAHAAPWDCLWHGLC